MSKIIGVTVGTPTSPAKMEKELKPVKTVNGKEPDENGNVEVKGAGGSGTPGKDGFSPIANVTETDSGAVITITDAKGTTTATVYNGHDGADGTAGKDGKDGKNGADGKTPVKGEDYFTEEDKLEIVDATMESLPVVTAMNFANFENGTFTETVDGSPVNHSVSFDDEGRPTQIDDIVITWG